MTTSTVFPVELLPQLDAALPYTYGAHDRETVQNALDAGILQLWRAKHSFVLTELVLHPTGKKTLHFFLTGGNLEELEPLYPVIEGWGRSQGCQTITAIARPGWSRTFLRWVGWKPELTVYVKEL